MPRGRPKGSKNKPKIVNSNEPPKKRGRKPKVADNVELLDLDTMEDQSV